MDRSLIMNPFPLHLFDSGLSFASPEWFLALLLLLPLVVLFFQAGHRRDALLSKILAPRLHQQLAGRVSPLKRNLRSSCLLLSLVMIIVALAQPRFGSIEQEIKSHGRDVIIAIDTSKSMLSTDTAPTRLGRAKLIAQDLLNFLKGDRVGLIAFAGDAFLQAPLTLDKGAVLMSINDLDTNTIPKGGTDIASAIRMAIAAFGKGEGTSRALVLMTDGEELDEDGVAAAKEAGTLGIKIFTIGFGSAEGSLIPIRTESGQNDFVRDEHGRPVNSKLDAAKLTEIAKVTGGFYQPYGQDAAKIIYEKGILPIEGKDSGTLSSLKPIERYDWPVTAALVLLTLWSLLGEGRRKGSFIGALILAMGFFLNLSSLQASGINDYQQGNYQGALKDFEQRIQSGASSPEVRFDAGAAAYKEGDYKKAAGYFSEAMTSGNSKIRDAATYNLANSLVRTGEAAQEKEGKLSDWKNALQHYESVLKSTPKNTQAKENRDIVRKLIENLKKQDKKKDPKDQKDQDKNKEKDQQKNDSSQGGGDGKKDQKDQHSKPDQQAKDDQKQEGKDKGGDQQKNQDQNKKEDAGNSQGENQKAQEQPSPQQDQKGQPTPTPSPSPDQEKGQERNPQQQNSSGSQPKDQGQQQGGAAPKPTSTPAENMKAPPSAEQGEKPEKSSSATEAAADENKEGKMSANQARALLRSMQDEEQHVLNQQNRAVEQPLHDW